MRHIVVRFVWILGFLATISPVYAGFDSGSKRRPGIAGLRDVLRAGRSRDGQDVGGALGRHGSEDNHAALKDPLRCFEVHHPVLTPSGPVVDERPVAMSSSEGELHSPACDLVLMEHSFANSYGSPYVAPYQPPGCPFNRVVLRLDVVSEGRQFDRLAVVYLGDVEIWRTSTAEPKPSPGIIWTIRKDFTPYLVLWRQPQTLIFDLGNLVNEKYTGAFNATLTATFFVSDVLDSNGDSADSIVSISARRGAEGKGSAFIYPETPAEAVVTLPRNINRGVLTIAATGQADEEFWWSNVPEKDKHVFNPGGESLPGLSSYREVQVRVDDQLVGLSLPFPVVFTGGIAPPLHRPVVGLQAFDLREHELDVSPFLGHLCDGEEHKFSIDVYGVDDSNGTVQLVPVPMHWVLTGKLFLWLDEPDAHTTGDAPDVSISNLNYTAKSIWVHDALQLQQFAERSIHVSSLITTQSGSSAREWRQSLTMQSTSILSDSGDTQTVKGLYRHADSSSVHGEIGFSTDGYYPINSDYRYRSPDGAYDFTINAALHSVLNLNLVGRHVFPSGTEPFVREAEAAAPPWNESTIHTSRSGTAFFYSADGGNSSGGSGRTDQSYELTAAKTTLYQRFVSVANETILHDYEFASSERHSQPIDSGSVGYSEPARQSRLYPTSPQSSLGH